MKNRKIKRIFGAALLALLVAAFAGCGEKKEDIDDTAIFEEELESLTEEELDALENGRDNEIQVIDEDDEEYKELKKYADQLEDGEEITEVEGVTEEDFDALAAEDFE